LTILDAYAALAFLKEEAAASEVEGLIAAGDAALTVVGLAEVLDHLIRIGGADEEGASLDMAQLGLDDPVPIDDKLASAAGRLRARRYHRVRCPVSLAIASRPRLLVRRPAPWLPRIRLSSTSATPRASA
jgi:PIN domain nuclease of toxin-antitoxin system